MWFIINNSVILTLTPTQNSLDHEPQTELAAQLAQEFYNFDMPLHIIKNLANLDFEVKIQIISFHIHIVSSLEPTLPLSGKEGCSSDIQ